MTRAVRNRILKDANGDISDHLRNHIHLTNCIHLKNHMHKHSPILADRSLLRDLVVLQRSRSLRDPSASPSSWHSPSIMDMLSKRAENGTIIQDERKSVGIEQQKDGRRSSKVDPGELSRNKATGNVAGGDRNSRSRLGVGKKVGREDSGKRCNGTNILGSSKEPPLIQEGKDSYQEAVSGQPESTDRKSRPRGKQIHDVQTENLSQQKSHDVQMDSDGVVSSNIHHRDRFPPHGKAVEEPEGGSVRGKCTGINRGKRRKFRNARRARAAASRDIGAENELSVASNSSTPGPAHHKYQIKMEEEGYSDRNVRNAPRNGCGFPWNWSIIHDRGKTFFDKAGRSFSCRLSDSRLKRGSIAANMKNISEMPVASDHSGSSTKSDAEAMPLLIEASGSHESTENVGWAHDYSGELGIYSDHLLKGDIDSDLASEVRSCDHHKFRSNGHTRYQNLTQKYMPKTFGDMVGQTLVVQALANAVIKRKVGLLYVFYGPHGTGKTSCARIFARALNCQSSEHPKPCSFCNSCIAYDLGKNRNIREVGPVSNFDFENIMSLLDNMIVSQLPAQYRVFIFDDCDTLSPDSWSAISKVIDRAPRRLVFILVSSSLDVLPHIVISRCQKFFYSKLKDTDIIYTLQWIASKEGLEIDKEALKLIASRSDGSLRDAEMTLEQLSLLGQRISVPLVQELVGLISDEKLVDLLDLALSADTVNTVKNLRVIMETGVESLALMSQLATVVTDILAGSYDFTQERQKRKFFRGQPLSKEDMEKLRQALKTLSEAEKQLRMSNDKLTWLTAALLQLAPDQQYMLPTSSDNSFNHSPLPLNNAAGRDASQRNNSHLQFSDRDKQLSKDARRGTIYAGRPNNEMLKSFSSEKKAHASTDATTQKMPLRTGTMIKIGERKDSVSYRGIEEIWLEVLEKIQVNGLKEFLYQEGNLSSVSFGTALTVQLMFNTQQAKATAEKFRSLILQSFESVLGSSVTIEIRCDPKNSKSSSFQAPIILATSKETKSQIRDVSLHADSLNRDIGEIEEAAASPGGHKGKAQADVHALSCKRSVDGVVMEQQASSEKKKPAMTSIPEGRKLRDGTQSQSLVRSKVSLAHVIQQAEGSMQRNSWSKRRAVSIAEKLEQENLRLESRSRSLLCWRASSARRKKPSRLKTRTRKPHKLMELVSCGRCLSTKSPR